MFLRKPDGYHVCYGPEGLPEEWHSLRCVHCQHHTRMPAGRKPDEYGGFCRLCMGFLCKACAGKDCDVFEKKLERAEALDRFRRSVG